MIDTKLRDPILKGDQIPPLGEEVGVLLIDPNLTVAHFLQLACRAAVVKVAVGNE